MGWNRAPGSAERPGAQPLTDAARGDHLTRQYYDRPPLLDTLLLPDDAQLPKRKYLDWRREEVFFAC
jgi:hypothetical protein